MRLLALRTVVVAVELDGSSAAALDTAHRLAQAAGARLHVVHASGLSAEAAVREACRHAGVADGDAEIVVVPGAPVEVIRRFADRTGADVVVVGSHRRGDVGASGRELGGTARAVVEGAFAPCLVARVPLRLPLERVLVPIDSSETARGALVAGLSWASALRRPGHDGRTSLTVLHVDTAGRTGRTASRAPVDRELELLHENVSEWAGVDIRGVAVSGADAAAAIADHAVSSGTDLVVMGTRGLGLDEAARLGSVSASLMTRLSSPMLLVPPAVWRAYAVIP